MEKKNAWEKYPEGKKRDEVFSFAEDYRKFISDCKTERECTSAVYKDAVAHGYKDLDELIKNKTAVKAGDRIVADNMGKGVALFNIGKKSIEDGMNILGAHIDSPRMDLKQVPLYEDTEMALLDTHYYGGIKKYQWVTLPLALHGVICKKDGTTVKVNIGDKPGDPVVGVSDLLIHLSGDQMSKKASEVIEGENLDVLIGSIPGPEKDENDKDIKDRVKSNILNILSKEYKVDEDDFLSAEIEVVPAGEARDYGLDRSMIMGYGHDDRVCAYPSYRAMLEVTDPEYTSVCLLVDKEEIGSVGASGMQSRFFENCVAEVMNLAGEYYINKTGRRITFEYSLVAGVNDGKEDAKSLSKLVKGMLCHVNLIPVNEIKENTLKRPSKKNILEFEEILKDNGIEVTVRREMGTDINAACGQLRRSYLEENR